MIGRRSRVAQAPRRPFPTSSATWRGQEPWPGPRCRMGRREGRSGVLAALGARGRCWKWLRSGDADAAVCVSEARVPQRRVDESGGDAASTLASGVAVVCTPSLGAPSSRSSVTTCAAGWSRAKTGEAGGQSTGETCPLSPVPCLHHSLVRPRTVPLRGTDSPRGESGFGPV